MQADGFWRGCPAPWLSSTHCSCMLPRLSLSSSAAARFAKHVKERHRLARQPLYVCAVRTRLAWSRLAETAACRPGGDLPLKAGRSAPALSSMKPPSARRPARLFKKAVGRGFTCLGQDKTRRGCVPRYDLQPTTIPFLGTSHLVLRRRFPIVLRLSSTDDATCRGGPFEAASHDGARPPIAPRDRGIVSAWRSVPESTSMRRISFKPG